MAMKNGIARNEDLQYGTMEDPPEHLMVLI